MVNPSLSSVDPTTAMEATNAPPTWENHPDQSQPSLASIEFHTLAITLVTMYFVDTDVQQQA